VQAVGQPVVTFKSGGRLQWCGVIGALGLVAVFVSGCASVIEGRSQQISVNTNPPGAECGFYREEGVRIAAIQKTPGKALVEKTKSDIWIVCVKPGYQQATYLNHSGISGAVFVNVIGGIFTLGISTVIGAAVDSSNGSDNLYQSPVNVAMAPNVSGSTEGPSILPQSFTAERPVQSYSQQVAAPVGVVSTPAEPSSQQTNVSVSAVGRPEAQAVSKPETQIAAAPARPSGTLPAPGIWDCGFKTFKLQIVVAADHSMIVTSYANAAATVTTKDPLTFTAMNPRGSRLTTFIWNSNNTMTLTGPKLSDPASTFHNEGACAKT
jgi:hypothetical protein